MKRRSWWLVFLPLALVAASLLPAAVATAQPVDLSRLAVDVMWARADYPVFTGRVQRGYYFGPRPIRECAEVYQEAAVGRRMVRYYDKARLEVLDPGSSQVTAGLLARELISGKMQIGDSRFRTWEPAVVPIAGDPDSTAAPTYASFTQVASLDPGMNRAPERRGHLVTATLNRAGQVGDDPDLGRYGVRLAEYRDELGHHIPDVFVDFFNQRGLVATMAADGTFNYSEDLLIDWLRVIGLPLAEPYWAVVPVGRVGKWVLIQPYERRVLTYTPDNDPAFRVEMGNTGQHYLTWRYLSGHCVERLGRPVADPGGDAVPDGKNAGVDRKLAPWGTTFHVTAAGFQPQEPVKYELSGPGGNPILARQTITARRDGLVKDLPFRTHQEYDPGLWSVAFEGEQSGHHATAYFRIIDRPPAPAPDEPVPDDIRGTVTPKYGWQGTIIRIQVAGFAPNEPITVATQRLADRSRFYVRDITRPHDGRVTELFATNDEMGPGLWQVTYRGKTSGQWARIHFYVLA